MTSWGQMKPATRWVAALALAWVAAVSAAASGQQPAAQAPAPAGTQAPPGEKSPQQIIFERFQRAERVMNASCSASNCHTTRPIATAAKDEAGWNATVDAMVEKGATLTPADRDVLIEYLVRYHGPLPDGEGRSILLNTCTLCHDLQRVRTRRMTIEGWKELLDEMIAEGAPLSDDQIPILLTYLARNFHL
jgi:cytochrome c5